MTVFKNLLSVEQLPTHIYMQHKYYRQSIDPHNRGMVSSKTLEWEEGVNKTPPVLETFKAYIGQSRKNIYQETRKQRKKQTKPIKQEE